MATHPARGDATALPAPACHGGAPNDPDSIDIDAVAPARATRLHGLLAANVDDFYDGRISYEAFGVRAKSLWDEVKAEGLTQAVVQIIRDRAAR